MLHLHYMKYRKFLIILVLLLCRYQLVQAQNHVVQKRNAIYIQSMGLGIANGANTIKWDHHFANKYSHWGMSAGFGVIGFLTRYTSDKYKTEQRLYWAVPLELYYSSNIQKSSLFIDVGAGIYFSHPMSKNGVKILNAQMGRWTFLPNTYVAARYQKNSTYFSFGFNIPFVYQLSLGKSF